MQFQTIIIKDENIDDSVSQRNTISINSETNLLSKISSKATSNPDTNTKYSCKRLKTKHPEIAGSRKRRIPRCIHCNKTFASKQALDGHIIRRHPDFIASVSAKVHECTKCTYKTVNIAHLKRHIKANHPDIADSSTTNSTTKRCIHCIKTFASNQSLDDHIVKRHPDFIESVFKCIYCNKTFIRKDSLEDHIVKRHPVNRVSSRCIYCNKTFVRKETLEDHIVKTHPHFIAFVSKKIHECTKCTFKTVSTRNLKRHIVTKNETPRKDQQVVADKVTDGASFICYNCKYVGKSKRHLIDHIHLKEHIFAKHPDIAVNREISRCIYCHKTFVRKEALDDHVVKRHPDFIASVSRKVHECTKCTFKTISSNNLKEHILAKHPDIAGHRVTSTCIYCNKTFVRKETLDDHIVRTHPDFIASVSRKVHECTRCTYKTVRTSNLKEHIMANHPDIAAGNRLTNRCIYCNKIFVRKRTLDDHIVKRHPDFITSVSRKVHECTKCTYRTVSINHLKEHITVNHPDIGFQCHLLKHPETAATYKYRTCSHCKASFTRQEFLNEHILQIHPQFTASIARKVLSCPKCAFKTTISRNFQRHLLEHPETAVNYKFSVCIHCTEPFKSITMLDEHIIKKHPSSIPSITRKIHKCTTCDFSTTIHTEFKRHQLKHTDTYINRKSNICVHCNKSFLSKSLLDDHIVKKHPSFICSVTSKIRECTKCSYKTTIAGDLKKHMVQHPDVDICVHCNKSFLNKTLLDDHIVKKHPSFIYSVTSKIRECTKCSYKTTIAGYLKRHMVQHPDGIPATKYLTGVCTVCNTAFKTHDSLNEHIIKKHPKFIASITRKIHACTKCNFKTVYTSSFQCHLLKHPETAAAYNYRTCSHCNAAFTRQEFLNEHILQIHPQFTASITQKLLLCSKCTFKTAISRNFQRHLLEHPETAVNYKFSVCIHCNEPFKSITMLDEHIIKKHPSSIPSITRKIHKCTTCDFSTTIHTEFKRHQLKHTDAYINRNSNICVHCNKSFLSKTLLDDHIVKKHPSFIYSVTSKIRECTKCSYKTTIAGDLKKHMMQHPDLSGGEIFNRCMYCDKTFIHKRTLGEHIIKNHPSYISSVTNKIHECTKCNFKTVDKRTLRRHGCQNVEVTELVLS
nr:unnamed protein product [Callosobruchus analis]